MACPCAYVELIRVHRLAWSILRVLYLPLPAWYSVIFRSFLFSRGDLFFRCLRNLSSLGQMLLSKEKLQQWGRHVLLCCPYTKSVDAHDPPEGGKSVQGPSFSRDADGPRSCHSSSTRFLTGKQGCLWFIHDKHHVRVLTFPGSFCCCSENTRFTKQR